MASGEITLQVYQRLSTFPDIAANDKLANALQNRITKILDDIVFDGKQPVVDAFLLDPTDTATTKAVQYVNLYATQKLEEKRMQMLRDFVVQISTLKAQAAPPPLPQMTPAAPGVQNPNQAPPTAPR